MREQELCDVFSKLTLEMVLQSPLADLTTSRIAAESWGRIEELHLRRGLPLLAIAMMSKRIKVLRITTISN